MKRLFKTIFFLAALVLSVQASAAPNSETYVTVQSDDPTLKYREGQQAGFSIFEVAGWEGLIEVDVFFQDESTPLAVTDMSTFKYVQTPTLQYGPAQVIFNVYEIDQNLIYIVRTPKRTLLETFNIEFNVRYDDSNPPVLAVMPEEDTVFIDDMPFIQVDYSDTPAGVDTATFKAFVTDQEGTRTEVTSLFTVTSDFATVQFDEVHKLPIGTIFFEVEIADNNENVATKTIRYVVEVPVPTAGYYNGKVVDNTGAPVEGAEVSILSGGVINVRTVVQTDIEGKYKVPVGQGGEVLLSATKGGWTSQSKFVEGEAGKDSAVATFVIKPLDANSTFIDKITGGFGTNADNTVEFHVAPNSASNDIYLNITQARAGNELPGALPILSEFTFMGTMGPSGTTFSPPGKLRIKNDLGFPANTPIVVGMFNKTTGVWEDSGHDAQVTADGQFVEYDMPHFSSWDANQPVVPPSSHQPSAQAPVTDQSGSGCQSKGCRIDVENGNLGVDYDLPGVVRFGTEYKPTFTYWSQSARPVIFANAEQFFHYLAFGDHPDVVNVELTIGNLYRNIYYKGKGTIPSGDTVYSYRMMMEARGIDGQYMPTGIYDFNVKIGNDYRNSRFATALYFGAPPLTPLNTITPEPVSLKYNVSSRSIVLNSRNSPFGKGWTLQGLEKLTEGSGYRLVWEDGSGKASLYTGIPNISGGLTPGFGAVKQKTKKKMEPKNIQVLDSMNVTSMIEKDGAIFVADCASNRVFAVGVTGTVTAIAGSGTAGFSGDGGDAKLAELSCPSSVFASYDGGLLIADKNNFRIRKVSKYGIITTVAGNGQSSESQDGGAAVLSSIGAPTFVSEDKLHSIHFITGNRVRFVDPRGRLSTLVASNNAYYKADLSEPSQILYDELDNPIIVDSGNDRIVKVFLQSGDVRVLAGSVQAKGSEKITKAEDIAAGSTLKRPIAYLRDKKAQLGYILDDNGNVIAHTHDGRLLKTSLKSKFKSLILSKNVGLVGAKSIDMDTIGFISPPGDFSTLAQTVDGFVRTQQNGNKSYFNNDGLLVSKTTPDGKNESFTYDSKGRLATWTIPGGDTYTFTYELFSGRLKEVHDPVGRVTKFSTNGSGHLLQVENPDGKTRKYTYDATDLLTTETDEDQKVHSYVYSSSGLLAQEIYPDGSIRNIKPRSAIAQMGNLPAGVGTKDNPADMPIFDKEFGEDVSMAGRSWKFKTDKFGKIVESVDGLGRATKIARDNNGQMTSSTDPLGGSTRVSYNANGLPIAVMDQAGNTRYMEYTSLARVSKVTDPLNRETTYTYDNQGNVTEIKDPLLRTTTIEYGPKGLPIKIKDHLNNEKVMTYDTRGQLATSTDALGKITEYTYNSVGLLTQVKDALNRITTYEYDSMNRLKKIVDPMNGETTFTYSNTGLLLSVTDPKNQTTSYTYNDRGWLASTTNALNQVETYTYDPDGLMLTKTRRDGSVIQYTYNEAKQLTRVGAPDNETKFNYDANGNLTWIWNKGSAINRQYTANNLLKTENQRGYNVSYTYNSVGTRQTMTANGNQTQYFYTGMDILNEIRAQINGQNYVWTRELDTLNRPIKDVLPNGIEVRRMFTALSQLASINNYSPNSNLISGFSYQYDDVGKRSSKTESFAGTVPTGNIGVMSNTSNYSYDDLDRLTASSSPRENFSYDVVGNRQFAAATNYNAINQLLGDGWKYSFEYNLNGDMTKKTNLLTGQETNFVWNAESQLTAIQIFEAGTVTKEIFFKYDGLGRRIERQVVDHTDNSKSYGRKFFYDGDMIIEEQDLTGNLAARYMNSLGTDDPLLVARAEGNFVFTKDGLGSIRELTKSDGTSIQKYRYSSYGVTTQELQENRPDKKLIENRYAYTGRELEDETGLYYYRARYYDPELGRFISEDPVQLKGGDLNYYAYVSNNPIILTDPTGKYPAQRRSNFDTGGVYTRPAVCDAYEQNKKFLETIEGPANILGSNLPNPSSLFLTTFLYGFEWGMQLSEDEKMACGCE
ncbi:RHS repeat-associated core domain-containing protein [Bdellovibrio sp. HCB-110]|uniref:RHS repeat-associated core domain-containing protein n=1 Tax=Bdellovibrio sp. HCB-110 TaxID=3391182 RepID=UPI0039B57FCB